MPAKRIYHDFICCRCGLNRVYGYGFKNGRKRYRCEDCKKTVLAHYPINYRRIDSKSISSLYQVEVKTFEFDSDVWDIRALRPTDDIDRTVSLNFIPIALDWFKTLVKQYIYQETISGSAVQTVLKRLICLRQFACYLEKNNVQGMNEITRNTVLNFMAISIQGHSSTTITNKLVNLRHFFYTGNIHKWFLVSEHLIRFEDFPKVRKGAPKDIPYVVLQQIENNLHKLPDPIARAWLISYFCGMRISEIQLLNWDCLKQDSRGQWFITFWRKKIKDWHTLPISIEGATLVQEQQNYIRLIFDTNFRYLFHDYLGLDVQKFSFDSLKPIARVMHCQLLTYCINHLIQIEDVKDENGKIWHFTTHQIRDTRLTDLFEAGHELSVVSKWAGHKKIKTSQKYVRVKDHTLRKETAAIQRTLLNIKGETLSFEKLPTTLQENPNAHTLSYDNRINTPIYGYCGLPLNQNCPHWKACYTCPSFIARQELLPDYIQISSELKAKQARAEQNGETALVDQFKQQADSLDTIIATFEELQV